MKGMGHRADELADHDPPAVVLVYTRTSRQKGFKSPPTFVSSPTDDPLGPALISVRMNVPAGVPSLLHSSCPPPCIETDKEENTVEGNESVDKAGRASESRSARQAGTGRGTVARPQSIVPHTVVRHEKQLTIDVGQVLRRVGFESTDNYAGPIP